MRVLSLVNHKGGCGKTTTAIHLAGAFAARGLRVLVCDLDPQAHATAGLGYDAEERPCAREVLAKSCAIEDALVTAGRGLALLPAHERLAEYEESAAQSLAAERALREALARVAGRYDWVLVDCPPRADGVLVGNALAASSTVLLVVETGAFALQGALRAARLVHEAARAQGSRFEVRALATMFDRRTPVARELLVALQARFGSELLDAVIRTSPHLREAAAAGATIQAFAPRSGAARDFADLADELGAAAPRRTSGAAVVPGFS
jgi:chromosome partitioning protein